MMSAKGSRSEVQGSRYRFTVHFDLRNRAADRAQAVIGAEVGIQVNDSRSRESEESCRTSIATST